ncbi:MAG: T9SS type A sorting domain-containing protein, partial [Bacteroidetes bacterium]|nr:T9SS type A sorting domain-containing protein [Bacteroidota bacterium]
DQGADMIWNPSDRIVDNLGNPVMGGVQPIYVFNSHQKSLNLYNSGYDLGYYDPNNVNNNALKDAFVTHEMNPSSIPLARNVYSNLAWVGYPVRQAFQKNLASSVFIKIRVSKEYRSFTASGENNARPSYSWNMDELATSTGNKKALSEILSKIEIVPNPYYAYSQYERNRLDTRVKITNLPEKCMIRIYSTNGKLIKTYKKDNAVTFQDWDMNNFQAIPIASGIYIIHIEVPEVGDRVLKFFAGIRNIDFYSI